MTRYCTRGWPAHRVSRNLAPIPRESGSLQQLRCHYNGVCRGHGPVKLKLVGIAVAGRALRRVWRQDHACVRWRTIFHVSRPWPEGKDDAGADVEAFPRILKRYADRHVGGRRIKEARRRRDHGRFLFGGERRGRWAGHPRTRRVAREADRCEKYEAKSDATQHRTSGCNLTPEFSCGRPAQYAH